MSKNLAKSISIILGPQVWIPVLFIILIFYSGLNNYQLFIIFPSTLLLQVILPLGYLFLAPKFGLATAWDLPKKEERRLFFIIVSLGGLITLFLTYHFGTRLLFNLSLLLLTGLFLIAGITYYWKISLHTSLNTVGSILINFIFGWNLWFLYLTIPIIFWARFILHKHSVAQLVAGIVITALVMLLGLKLLGY